MNKMLAIQFSCIPSSNPGFSNLFGLDVGNIFGYLLTIGFLISAAVFIIGLIVWGVERIRGGGSGGKGHHAIIGGLLGAIGTTIGLSIVVGVASTGPALVHVSC
jgi:hypothetical protein